MGQLGGGLPSDNGPFNHLAAMRRHFFPQRL